MLRFFNGLYVLQYAGLLSVFRIYKGNGKSISIQNFHSTCIFITVDSTITRTN